MMNSFINRIVLIVLSFLVASPLLAQSGSASKRALKEEYLSFRRECMKEYIEFVREAWKEYEGEPPIERPKDQDTPLVMAPLEEGEAAQPVPETNSFFSFVGNMFKKRKSKPNNANISNPIQNPPNKQKLEDKKNNNNKLFEMIEVEYEEI